MKLKNPIKLLIIIFLLAFSLNLIAIPVKAQAAGDSPITAPWDTNLNSTVDDSYNTTAAKLDLYEVIGNIIKIVLGFLGLVLLILIIYGGFLWMTSSGDDEKVKKARKIITSAVIGVLIVVCAYIITYFVIDQLTEGIMTGTIPTT